jgi:hypothetical protein
MALLACFLNSLSKREPDIGDTIYSFLELRICLPFEDNEEIEYAILRRGTKIISRWTFAGCRSLIFVFIPDSVTSICGGAFSGCTSLSSVVIPNSVTRIGIGSFEGCTSLSSVTIPDSVTNIEHFAFWGCTNLSSVTISSSITEIGICVFEGCTRLPSVTRSDKSSFPFHKSHRKMKIYKKSTQL